MKNVFCKSAFASLLIVLSLNDAFAQQRNGGGRGGHHGGQGRNHQRPVVNRPAPRPHHRPVVVRPAPHHRPAVVHHGWRPRQYNQRPYVRYVHAPYRPHSVRAVYHSPYNYYNYVYRNHRNHLYRNWVFWGVTYGNGYRLINGNPYFVYNGYAHRYNAQESCNYQLVDTATQTVVQSYWNQSCHSGYNSCSLQRDSLNDVMNQYRYACAENFRFDSRNTAYDYQDQSYDPYSDTEYYDDL